MAHVVSDGLTLVQATGQKVRDGVGTAATGIRSEIGAVANGIQHEIGWIHDEIDHLRHSVPAAHKQDQHKGPVPPALAAELLASVAGGLAAFFVSRLVRSRLDQHGRRPTTEQR